jgi:hypothetical protein
LKIDFKNLEQITEDIDFLTHYFQYSIIPLFHGSGMSQELLKDP